MRYYCKFIIPKPEWVEEINDLTVLRCYIADAAYSEAKRYVGENEKAKIVVNKVVQLFRCKVEINDTDFEIIDIPASNIEKIDNSYKVATTGGIIESVTPLMIWEVHVIISVEKINL